jgi:DNA mismatch repair protein MutS2
VITTHYSNLKHFASGAEGVVNGAMMFDTGKMKPLFRLEMGKPGSSFAIDIARQIGLPEELLGKAASKVGEDHINFDRHLREILRDKRYWEEKRDRIRVSEKKLAALLEQYETELGQAKKMRKEVMDTAKREATDLLANANKEIEKTIRIIRETQADKEVTREARKELDTFKKEFPEQETAKNDPVEAKLEEVKRRARKFKPADAVLEPEPENDGPLAAGDLVRLKSLGIEGEVLEVNGENLLVTYGESLITTVKLAAVERTKTRGQRPAAEPAKSKKYDWSISQRRLNFSSEIDIRGKRGEEAVDIVRHFVDDAMVVGVSDLRILHGKGNGILKSMVREYLHSLNVVKSCKDERVELGGAGITLVTLDF